MKKVFLLLTVTFMFLVACKNEKFVSGLTSGNEPQAEPSAIPVAPLDMARVHEIAAMLPDKPKGFGENYHNRETWEKLSARADFKQAVSEAEGLLGQKFPAWNDEAYLMYFTAGTRPEGQKMLRDRSGWLPPLVIAECVENKGRFMPAIEMALKELLMQKSWVLPAHDRGKQNFEGKNFTVDLNSSAFSHTLGQVLYLLDDKLNPSTRKSILEELYKRTFNPVMGTIEGKNNDHWWITTTNNWNAVCLAGVVGAALSAIPEKEERAKFVAIGEKYSKNSIIGFADDGYCSEGMGYFSYGFGNYVTLREELLQATGKKIDLFADQKVMKIGAYPTNLEILNDIYPTIADCRAGVKAPAETMWYISRNLGLGISKYDTLRVDGSAGSITAGLMYAFPNSASMSQPAGEAVVSGGLRSWFNYAGVLVVRPAEGGKFAAALKGGHNNEHHNHNDVGSYTIVVGDELLMGDPGGPEVYRSNTFGAERYTYKNLASYGHPVPLPAGKEQVPGRKAEAKILRADFSDKTDIFAMDISTAYEIPDLKIMRTFTYSRKGDGMLTVEDDFAFGKEDTFETALITRSKCTMAGKDQLEFAGERNKMRAIIEAPAEYEVTYETISGDFEDFTRVAIKLKNPLQSGKLKITFKPLI